MTIEKNNFQKVLIIDDFHPTLLAGLETNQIEFDYLPGISKEEVLSIINVYTGLIVRSKINCDVKFFEKAVNLKWIAKGGSGLDNIDESAAAINGVRLINAPEGNKDAVAEHAMGLMLSLSSKINFSYQQVKQLKWNREQNRGIEIMGKTIGIIGYGNNGSAFAKRLSGFGVKVLAFDKYSNFKGDQYAEFANMEQIFEQSDWLSLHIPLTNETKGLVNKDFIKQFKKSIGLINTSRGAIVQSIDVLEALRIGSLFAFGADVLENENPEKWTQEQQKTYTQLMQLDQVIITPHIAGWSVESYQRIANFLLNRIVELTNK